jgi:hypothetical protein
MEDIVEKALKAIRESKSIEFKQSFNPQSSGEWCELTKDLVAIANSGGGIIVFGLDSSGRPSGQDVEAILGVDPADIANKVSRYTGLVDFTFEIRALEKNARKLAAFVIPAVSVPLVFQKPGTYEVGEGKQRTAFATGTVYFRHGAKSEPGTSEDIRRVIERQLDHIRKSWIKGVRRVVQAPGGSHLVSLIGAQQVGALASRVTIVSDPKAIPVRITRDPTATTGVFVHEAISDAIFDEINNVIHANRVLAKGQPKFMLGQALYHRIYAERQYVNQSEDTLSVLFTNGFSDFYAPALFWGLKLSDATITRTVTRLYLCPTSPPVHSLLRFGLLLGQGFCEWLLSRWKEKWKGHPQPPAFYFTLKESVSEMKVADPRLLAARFKPMTRVAVGGESEVLVKDLLQKPEQAAGLLSKACMQVFQGSKDDRATARNLDYFVHGPEFQQRGESIAKGIIKQVGNRKPGDMVMTDEME